MGCVQSRGLGVSFSDTLLVVSILDVVLDCHLRPLLQSCCSPEGVINGSCGNYGSLLGWG